MSMILYPWTEISLPTLGLGLNTISKPLTSRAQFSCRSAAHGTDSEIVWMNPAVTSKGASAVSSSSFSDWTKETFKLLLVNAYSVLREFPSSYNEQNTLCVPIYPVALVPVIPCLDRGLS